MSERHRAFESQPPDLDDISRRMDAVQASLEAVSGDYELGTITVAYDSPAYDTGQAWIRAECSVCPAEVVMRASDRLHMRYLALTVATSHCTKFNHEQDIETLTRESYPYEKCAGCDHFVDIDDEGLIHLGADHDHAPARSGDVRSLAEWRLASPQIFESTE